MHHSFEFDKQEIVVLEGEWKSSSGGVLYTQNASSCTIVAIHNQSIQTGYLGHFRLHDENNLAMLDDILCDIYNSGINQNGLEITLTGASYIDERSYDVEVASLHNELAEYGRRLYIDRLLAFGASPLMINEQWLGVNEQINTLMFDTFTGKIFYVTQNSTL